MEYSNRGQRQHIMGAQSGPQNTATQPMVSQTGVGGGSEGPRKRSFMPSMRVIWVAMLFLGTALAAAVIAFIAFSPTGPSSTMGGAINTDKYQAVFLNGGQVYFGKMAVKDHKTLVVSDIYYLRVNQQVQPGSANSQTAADISLAKLGKELHGPEDVMYINREQVLFWENLTDDGAVVKAIKQYKEDPAAAEKAAESTTQSTTPSTTPATTQTTTPTTNP